MKTQLSCLMGVLFAMTVVVRVEPPDAKTLTEIAARYRVPMPPKDAKLVLAHTEGWTVLGNQSTSRDPGIYSPAYLLEEKADGSIVILRGMERQTLRKYKRDEPLWRAFSTEEVESKLGGYVVSFDRLSAFVCFVQCVARGDNATAQRIWQRVTSSKWWSDSRFGEPASDQLKDPPLLLARCLFDHLRHGLLEERADWSDIRAQMKDLFDRFPKLKSPERSQLFEELSLTIRAKTPAPRSVEALLLDWSRQPSNLRHLGLFYEHPTIEADAPARELVLRGLDAVPELLTLLDDRRITAHEDPAFMNARARIRRVGELANLLLQELAGWERPFWDGVQDVAKLRAWWAKNRGQSEQEFLVKVVFRRDGDKIASVSETPARTLALKYPETLSALCEEFLKHATAEAYPFELAEAVAGARLPKDVRVKVLSEFAQRGSLQQRRCVLQNLARIDGKKCAELLVPVLKRMATDVAGSYGNCPEAAMSHVVMEVDDDSTWRDYLRVVKRSSVGLRMEMMEPMSYGYISDKNRGRRLAFLAAFLDDGAVRDISAERGKFDGAFAAFTFRRIEVRDFAAMAIASILIMDDAPDEFWTPAEWTAFRERVRKKLSAEMLPNLGTPE
jgi:hypothetical protein